MMPGSLQEVINMNTSVNKSNAAHIAKGVQLSKYSQTYYKQLLLVKMLTLKGYAMKSPVGALMSRKVTKTANTLFLLSNAYLNKKVYKGCYSLPKEQSIV